jgi:hypothetical protein
MHALVQGDSPEKRRALYSELRKCTLMLATPGEPLGKGTAEAPREIRFIASTDATGKTSMLAFTSDAAIAAWRPAGCVVTEMPARSVFALAVQQMVDRIIINPRGPTGGFLMRREILALAEGWDPGCAKTNIGKGTKVAITPPAIPPSEEFLAALRTRSQAMPTVRALYLVTGTIGDGEPHYLVGVELGPGAHPDVIIPALLQAVQPIIGEGEYLDFIPLRENTVSADIRARGLRVV